MNLACKCPYAFIDSISCADNSRMHYNKAVLFFARADKCNYRSRTIGVDLHHRCAIIHMNLANRNRRAIDIYNGTVVTTDYYDRPGTIVPTHSSFRDSVSISL